MPVTGGLYDQHPRLLAEWDVIFQAKNRHEVAQQKREEEMHKRPKPPTKSKRR